MFCANFNFQTRPRACLIIHSRHLYAPLRGILAPNSDTQSAMCLLFGMNLPQSVTHSCQKAIFKHTLERGGKQLTDTLWNYKGG